MVEFLLELVCDVDADKIEVLRERLITDTAFVSLGKIVPYSYSSRVSVVDMRSEPWFCHGRKMILFSSVAILAPGKHHHIYPWPFSIHHKKHHVPFPVWYGSQHDICESPRIEPRRASAVLPHVQPIPSQICLARQHGIRWHLIVLSTSSTKHFPGTRELRKGCRRHSKS